GTDRPESAGHDGGGEPGAASPRGTPDRPAVGSAATASGLQAVPRAAPRQGQQPAYQSDHAGLAGWPPRPPVPRGEKPQRGQGRGPPRPPQVGRRTDTGRRNGGRGSEAGKVGTCRHAGKRAWALPLRTEPPGPLFDADSGGLATGPLRAGRTV